MKNDDKLLGRLRNSIYMAFIRVPGKLDILAQNAGLLGDWNNFKGTAPSIENALLQFIEQAQAKHVLVDYLEAALSESEDATLQTVANQLLRPLQEPLTELGAKLGKLEKVLFHDIGFADITRWIHKLGILRRAVCFIRPDPSTIVGCGTGFLVAPDLVLTNWHVAEPFWTKDEETSRVSVQFDYEMNPDGNLKPATQPCRLKPEWNLPNSPVKDRDFALLRLDRPAAEDLIDGSRRGFLGLSAMSQENLVRSLEKGPPLLILQHPQAEPLKLALGAAVEVTESRYVWYTVNTDGGSSVAPCLSQSLEVIGLHHYGEDIKNRGILASAILPTIKPALLSDKPVPREENLTPVGLGTGIDFAHDGSREGSEATTVPGPTAPPKNQALVLQPVRKDGDSDSVRAYSHLAGAHPTGLQPGLL